MMLYVLVAYLVCIVMTDLNDFLLATTGSFNSIKLKMKMPDGENDELCA